MVERYNKRKNLKINFKHLDGVDRYLRFESLKTDIDNMFEELEINIKLDIPIYNKTANRKSSYKEYYNKEAQKVIAKLFEEELDYLKYTF
jgi:hypothetical protein